MNARKMAPLPESVTYCRTFPGKWPGVVEWIVVHVRWFPSAGAWEADCSVGFPTERREQWNTRKVFVKREDAAGFAADFVVVAEQLVVAVERGEAPYMPHRGMAAACAAAMSADPELVELADVMDRAPDRRTKSDARSALERARDAAVVTWYRAHDWREFRIEVLSQETAAA